MENKQNTYLFSNEVNINFLYLFRFPSHSWLHFSFIWSFCLFLCTFQHGLFSFLLFQTIFLQYLFSLFSIFHVHNTCRPPGKCNQPIISPNLQKQHTISGHGIYINIPDIIPAKDNNQETYIPKSSSLLLKHLLTENCSLYYHSNEPT